MSKRKRPQRYISTEERYLPSGEVYKVTPPTVSTWNIKTIMNNEEKRTLALKEAQTFMKQGVSAFAMVDHDHGSSPWGQQIDDLFFSKRRRGLVSFWISTGSILYYEFEGRKLQETMPERQTSEKVPFDVQLQQQGEMMRHALVLFYDFQEKRRTLLRNKLEQSKAALPITPFANAIIHTLKEHRLLLIAGDTGCGKSTQVPQILMHAGFQKIAVTQPRRIACSSLAKRVSYETMNEYGSDIAYQVRFEGTKTQRTRILFLTEGLLLRQYAMDQNLSMYNVIVVDEVHERHMMGDFLLALLKKLLKTRQDLYIVLMSATINAELFAHYFDAPTLEVPGKMYEVKVHYWNHERHEDKRLIDDAAYEKRRSAMIKESIPSRSDRLNAAPYLNIMSRIDETVPSHERGDLLIFVSGINEIMTLEQELRIYAEQTKRWIILILHSSVAVDDQEKIFDTPPQGVRKCIISSNIAETSITIDGIRFIIDSGKVKESNHELTTNIKKLSEFWISKASAKQRAGRAGRTGPGECYRLYSQNEYLHFNDYPVPEILRHSLESIILNIKALNLGDPRTFDYMEAPSTDSIEASVKHLQNLGALDEKENITNLGSVLSNLPVDVIIGKMLLLGYILRVSDPTLTAVACMSVQSPFVHVSASSSSNTTLLQNQKSFASPHGDPFTLLNVWQSWLEIKNDRKQSSRHWCRRHGIEEQRLYEITKIRSQFERILKDFQSDTTDTIDNNGASNQDLEQSKQARYQQRAILKREKFGQQSQRKRRILSVNQDYDGDNDDDDRIDIRALEFSMTNDLKRLQRQATLNLSDDRTIQLLKLIICSSLYPQYAMGDPHNPYRKTDELVFHTPVASFLSLHPTSTLAHHPDWVRESGENVRKDDLQVEQGIENQLLCYLELLETKKPYLLNMIRTPGIHTLLLFSKQLDTNEDCTVLVADSFYMIQFKTREVAQHVLRLAYKLRNELERLFNQKLGQSAEMTNAIENDSQRLPLTTPSVRQFLPLALQDILDDQNVEMQPHEFWTPAVEAAFQSKIRSLSDKLIDFMMIGISATLSIGKASQFLQMYLHWKERPETEQGLPRSWNPNDVIRKGIQITPHLWYNSLDIPSCASTVPMDLDNHIPDSVRFYHYCPGCDSTIIIRKSQLIEHVAKCHPA